MLIPAGLSHVVAIAAGENYAMALHEDGTLSAWGEVEGEGLTVPAGLTGAVALAVKSSRHVFTGTEILFHVKAVGLGLLHHQWRRNGTDLPGATEATFPVNPLTPADGGVYTVRVSNAIGEVVSQPAVLSAIASPPLILAQPASQKALLWGNAHFQVTADGSGPLQFQWRFRGGDIPGATNTALSLAGIRPEQAGDYSVVVRNPQGEAPSSNATLAVTSVGVWGADGDWQGTVPTGLSNLMAIAAGDQHLLALDRHGSVWGWGDSTYGQARIPTGLSNVVAIAAGAQHSLARLADGSVTAWGRNDFPDYQTVLPTAFTNVVAIAAGGTHNLALREDGTVVAWGNNAFGQTNVPAGLADVVAVAAGAAHALALRQDGTIVVWGRSAPVPVAITNAVAIAGGGSFSMALLGDGAPAIALQPANQTMFTGREMIFRAMAASAWPVNWQWRRNDLDLPGATQSTLRLAALRSDDAGFYAAVAFNAIGWTSSVAAVLTPVESPPILLGPPRVEPSTPGTTLMHINAEGSLPLSYQWQFEGKELPGATNASLMLSNVAFSPAGGYSVRITNALGVMVSEAVPAQAWFDYTFEGPGDPRLWDFSGTYPAPLSLTLRQTAGGGLTDDASTSGYVTTAADQVGLTLTRSYPVHYWVSLDSDIERWIEQDDCRTPFVLDEPSRVLSGTRTCTERWEEFWFFLFTWVDAGPGSDSSSAPVSVNLPAGIDGHWKLQLHINPAGAKLSGEAVITLGQTNVIPLPLRGTADVNTHKASLVLEYDWANRLTLDVFGSALNIQSMRGQMAGQSIQFNPVGPLPLLIHGHGSVRPALTGQPFAHGSNYVITAIPSAGQLFSNCMVNGVALGTPRLAFTMSPDLSIQLNLVPNPFLDLKGTYTGLFHDGNTPAHENAGLFTLTLANNGAYSGKVQQGAARWPFSGLFDLALSAHTAVSRRGTNALAADLQLTLGSDQVQGTIRNTDQASEAFGYRRKFNSTRWATNFTGSYNVLLPGDTHAATPSVGHGFARLSVTSGDDVRCSGALADGTAVGLKMPLAGNGQWPVYVGLYGGRGSIFGWLTLLDSATNEVMGRLLWTRPAGLNSPLYPDGLTHELETIGSRYSAPAHGQPILDLVDGVVALAGGNLSEPLVESLTLLENGQALITSTNANKLALTIRTSSGAFSGKVLLQPGGRWTRLQGLLLPKQQQGGGFFFGTNQSGTLHLGEGQP